MRPGATPHDQPVSPLPGRYTEAAMRAALARIAARLNADLRGAHLLHLANNAVFALPAAGLVVRITRSHTLHARAYKNVALGTWFAAVDAPTIRLADDIDQPVADANLLATVWRWTPPTPPRPDAADLGTAVRRFHALGPPPFELPRWDPVGDARTRLADAEELDDADRDYLLAWCDRLEPELAAFAAAEDRSLIHGDAHEANLLRAANGTALLCDFDSTTTGPWQVDLVPAAVKEIRFPATGGHKMLAAAYGHDVTADPAWPLLRQARELKMITAAVPLLTSAPGVATQFRLRLDCIRTGDTNTHWTPFGDLPH